MPYAPGFERALHARAAGRPMRKKSIRRISPTKAKRMLTEADRTRRAKHRGQARAIQRMSE
jgi:hypothetical protein